MKKSLLIFSVLAIFAMTGCKGGNGGKSGAPSGGDSSGGEEEKHNEITEAVNNTTAYDGSYTCSFDMVMGMDENEHEKISYNAETHQYYMQEENKTYVGVPQDNNLSKYYTIDEKDSSNSKYETTSTSFIDVKAKGYLQDGEGVASVSSTFLVLADSYYEYGNTNIFDKLLLLEMNDEMFKAMSVQASLESTTSSFTFGEPVDDVKSATYQISGVATSGAEYPKMDYTFSYIIKYTDKIVSMKQVMDFDYRMSEESHYAMAMTMSYGLSYSFDQSTYDQCLAKTESVSTSSGNRQNYASVIINGVDSNSVWSTFDPNEPITEEKIKAFVETHYIGIYKNATFDGIYEDPEYTKEFAPRNSTNYYERFYIRMTPKEGYTFLIEQYNTTIAKGTLGLSDEEFALYMKMIFYYREPVYMIKIISTASDYNVTYNNSADRGLIKSMKLDGEAFNSNKISKEVLASELEHELVFEVEQPYHQYGSSSFHAILADREILNNDSGILLAGPIDDSELYVDLNTSDYKKASRAGTIKAYKVDHVLAKGEALPAEAELLDESQIKLSFVAGGSTYATLPDSYNGKFTVIADTTNDISFVYLLLE